MSVKHWIYRLVHQIAPHFADNFRETYNLRDDAARFRKGIKAAVGLEQRAEFARHNVPFRAVQMQTEITGLLTLLSELKPQVVCEIGTQRGGTLALVAYESAPKATLVSIDIEFPPHYSSVYQKLIPAGQTLHCLQADSKSPQTSHALKGILNGQPIDFLFIDGDHSYEGVKGDYDIFSPLVRPGGIIGFHDIVMDHTTRFNRPTDSYTGGVPQFWHELKKQAPRWQEFIEDPEQDGYGIGVVFV